MQPWPRVPSFVCKLKFYQHSRRFNNLVTGRADRDPYDKRDSDNHGEREEAAYIMRALLLLGTDGGLDVRGVGSTMVAALRGVVDAGAGYADGAAHAARTHRHVRPAHPDGQARPRLGEVDRQPREKPHPAVESEVAHH